MTIKVAVLGASGRMGQAIIQALSETEGMQCCAAVVRSQSAQIGLPVPNLASHQYVDLATGLQQKPDVLIDFTLPDALAEHLGAATTAKIPMVIGTTGLGEVAQQQLDTAAANIPLLYAANTSVGVALLEQLVALASRSLPQADIEIIESHHKHKRDAPSGTALLLGEAAAKGRGQALADVSAGVRGDGLRAADEIGFACIRAADIIGEHSVLLAELGERIELTHKVSDRSVFAKGALKAANWLVKQPAGRYKMADMLGF